MCHPTPETQTGTNPPQGQNQNRQLLNENSGINHTPARSDHVNGFHHRQNSLFSPGTHRLLKNQTRGFNDGIFAGSTA